MQTELTHSFCLLLYSYLNSKKKKKKKLSRGKAAVVRTEWVDLAAAACCFVLVGTFKIFLLKVGSQLRPRSPLVHHCLIIIPLWDTCTKERKKRSAQICTAVEMEKQTRIWKSCNVAWKTASHKISVDMVFPYS